MLSGIAAIELLKMKRVELGLSHRDDLAGCDLTPRNEANFEVDFGICREQFDGVYRGESGKVEKPFSAVFSSGDMDRKRVDEGGENGDFETIETELARSVKPEINKLFDSRVRRQFDTREGSCKSCSLGHASLPRRPVMIGPPVSAGVKLDNNFKIKKGTIISFLSCPEANVDNWGK